MKISDIKSALATKARTVKPVTVNAPVPPEAGTRSLPDKPAKADIPVQNTSISRPVSHVLIPAKEEHMVIPAKDEVITIPAPQQNPPDMIASKKAGTRSKPKSKVSVDTTDIEAVVAKHLMVGRDYDLIPGCKKPSLLKPGAERLCSIFGFRTATTIMNRLEDYTASFVLYEVKVTVFTAAGEIQAEGVGECNSKERRYLKGDFYAQLNTVLKMAKKRAYVDALLTATHASGIFTQDVEDIAQPGNVNE